MPAEFLGLKTIFRVNEGRITEKTQALMEKVRPALAQALEATREDFQSYLLFGTSATDGGTSIPRPQKTEGKWSRVESDPHLWDVARISIATAMARTGGGSRLMGETGRLFTGIALLSRSVLDSYIVRWERKRFADWGEEPMTREEMREEGRSPRIMYPSKGRIPVWMVYEFGGGSAQIYPRRGMKRLRVEYRGKVCRPKFVIKPPQPAEGGGVGIGKFLAASLPSLYGGLKGIRGMQWGYAPIRRSVAAASVRFPGHVLGYLREHGLKPRRGKTGWIGTSGFRLRSGI